MPVNFSAYVDAAVHYAATHTSRETDGKAVGFLNGRLVTAGRPGECAVQNASRTDFLDSFEAEFGPELRVEAERMLGTGENAVPLTSRLILSINEMGRERSQGTVASRLKMIIANASRRDTVMLSQGQLEELKCKYAQTPQLIELFSEIARVRTEAEAAFAAVGQYTIAELARAVADRSPVDPANPISVKNHEIADTMRAAIERQSDLSHKLNRIYRASGGAFADIFPAIQRCDMRGTELNMLMKTAGKIVENDGERARKTVFEGLPDIAVEMHGTSAALDSLQGYLLPVANGFDALKHAAETGSADWRNLEMLRKDLDAAGKALAGAAEQGIQYPGTDSVFRPDPGLLVSLSKLLDGIRNDIAAFTAEYERASRLASIEGKCPDMSGTRLFSVFGQKIVDKIAGKGKAAEFVQCFAALRAMLVTIMISRSLSIFCNMKAAIDKIMFENRSLADDAAELSRNLRAMQRILRGEDEKDPRLAEVESKLRETIDSLAPSERDELEKELEDGKVIEAIDEIAAMNEALLEQTAKRLSDRMSVQKMH